MPPLEGFWWQDGVDGIDYAHKEDFHWISVIRLPDFVTEEDLRWAAGEAAKKKKQDFSGVEFLTVEEGLCVQCMHVGSYDDEPATVTMMHEFMDEKGYVLYYTSQCPFNAKYVPVLEQTARENGIPFHAIHIESKDEAQNAPVPITNYALFHDGDYITNEQMNDKKFLKLVNGH